MDMRMLSFFLKKMVSSLTLFLKMTFGVIVWLLGSNIVLLTRTPEAHIAAVRADPNR